IFRGALDVRARAINMEMKIAAARALAALAKEDVPDAVMNAYGGERFSFGPEYIIPKPFDERVLTRVAPAVARAAVETGVARVPIEDWDEYIDALQRRIRGTSHKVVRNLISQARRSSARRIVFPEATEEKILRACQAIIEEQIAEPVLIGDPAAIRARAEAIGIDLSATTIVDVHDEARCARYGRRLYELRQRHGVTPQQAPLLLGDPVYFGIMMVESGDADGLVAGLNRSYPDT